MKITAYIIFLFILVACSNTPEKENKNEANKLKEPLIKLNKEISETESEQIDKYIKRRNWNMQETGTGLRYMIYQNGNGVQAKTGNIAQINFEISLLNGTTVYSSNNKPEAFTIGHDNVESGLHEALTYLKIGDKAKVIIPIHLAFGLAGDMNKIPPRSTLVYDLELVSLK
ncbi:MAG: FKBP-type peptidyl-prolyl cis-trans isomerase [Flavobacteriales bacterium]|nr:FKBP-type peptidyl-prolyl cis-trans isomerase [Flavobacteriales bacterium]